MSAIKVLSAADILNADDARIVFVEVPEWRGGVHVREFSAAQREEFDSLLNAGAEDAGEGDEVKADTKNIRARVVALTACDAAGVRLFTVDQAEKLAAKSDVAIGRVFEAAAKLNKLRRIDREDEKKESADPQSGDSGTA